jgi:hypothetical protein
MNFGTDAKTTLKRCARGKHASLLVTPVNSEKKFVFKSDVTVLKHLSLSQKLRTTYGVF